MAQSAGAVSFRQGATTAAAAEPPCSCPRLRAGVRLRCARFEKWSQACNIRGRVPPGRYAALLAEARHTPSPVDSQTKRQVALDVDRTCPMLNFFQGGAGRDMLSNILLAWVVFDASSSAAPGEECMRVGYVQGMSFIAMNLLWHAGREEAAFVVFVAMMEQYGLKSMFEPPDMRGLKMRAFTVTQLLRINMPDLSDHLAEYLQNNLELLLADWLLTLFASSVALAPLALVWDGFFETGYVAIYRSILARLRCLQPWLLKERDFTRLTNLVRFAHVDFERVEGKLMPRLRGTQAVVGSDVPENERSFFGWMALTAVSFVTDPLMRSSKEASIETSCGQHAAAWICQVCSGGEECESWGCIVTELTFLEQVPAKLIERLEGMFGARCCNEDGNTLDQGSGGDGDFDATATAPKDVASIVSGSQALDARPEFEFELKLEQGPLANTVAVSSRAEACPTFAQETEQGRDEIAVDGQKSADAATVLPREAWRVKSPPKGTATGAELVTHSLATSPRSTEKAGKLSAEHGKEDLAAQNDRLQRENEILRTENDALREYVIELERQLYEQCGSKGRSCMS